MESPISYEHQVAVASTAGFFRRVYNWMTLGLVITAFAAVVTASTPAMINIIFGNKLVFWGILLSELALVFIISGAINRLSSMSASLLFLLYSALNGLTLSVIFLRYTTSSIGTTFFVTAGTFGAMSVYGHVTKKDLSSWGSFLFMGLFGIIIASVVNIFLKSAMVTWVLTYCGIIVFVGLTAYDTNKLRWIARQGFMDVEAERKVGILGALTLYLDFINLFLLLLRVLGRSDD